MTKFPVDAPIERILAALERVGFRVLRTGNHIALLRDNPDGTSTPLTIPNHRRVKSSTLRTTLSRTGITRDEFLDAYNHQ